MKSGNKISVETLKELGYTFFCSFGIATKVYSDEKTLIFLKDGVIVFISKRSNYDYKDERC